MNEAEQWLVQHCPNSTLRARWDLFCTVVDNFGDAGVAWRLARELARSHGVDVRLAIDDLATLAAIAPTVDPTPASQHVSGVHIVRWVDAHPAYDGAQAVIELFATRVDASYLEALADASSSASRPVWINLEYLSAEAWVAGHHGLPSPHPRLPLTQWFFFPGFDAASGGLLREAGLVAARDAEQARRAADAALSVSLFCYPSAPIEALLDTWTRGAESIHCRVPVGRAADVVAGFFGASSASADTRFERGAVAVDVIPFTDQDGYDRLLWASDLNFVRGEDSFVRAQWAARPFVWNIYPQADDAHTRKLNAFLDRYVSGVADDLADAQRAMSMAWNRVDEAVSVSAAWNRMLAVRPALTAHATDWAKRLVALPGLAASLRNFVESKR